MRRMGLWQSVQWALAVLGIALGLAAPGGASAAEPFSRGLLWRVDKPGVEASHLFGTVHLDDPRATALKPATARALRGSRQFVMELLPDDDSERVFLAASRLRDGLTLPQLIGDPGYERVLGVLTEHYGLTPEAVARLKPWAAYLALSQPMHRQGEIVDAVLHDEAQRLGLPIAPLETVDEQIASMEAVTPEHQRVMLDALARHHDEVMGEVEHLLTAYLAEDLAGIWRLENASIDDGPELQPALDDFIDQILTRRNVRMVERMQPHLLRGKAFVAMGALHLYGREGLLARLQRAGWRVRRGY